MKIGLYDPYLDTLGGGEKYMLNAALCLSKDHDVSIFWDDKKIIEKAFNRFSLDLTAIHFIPNVFSRGSLLNKIAQTQKFDSIFYLSDGSIPFVGSKKLFLHFQFPIEWVRPNLISKIKLSRVNAVICNSKFTKEYIDKKLNVSSVVIYPPININHKKNTKKNIILAVGRIQKNNDGRFTKKQEILINVFKKMVDDGLREWKFYVAGGALNNDSIVEELNKMVNDYPIKIFSNISAKELDNLYKEARIYWHATGYGENMQLNPERAEHFGMSTVEAMSNGAVPVVINLGGQKEIVDEGENGFLWDDQDELIEKTRLLIKSPALMNKLSQNAMDSAENFSQDKFCEHINELFTV